MASHTISSFSICSLLTFFSLLLSPLQADQSPSNPIPASSACNVTRYPDFCNSILPSNSSSNLFDYGRVSIKHSLSMARRFSTLVDGFLQHQSSLTITTIRALEDCQLLSELNQDFLQNAAEKLDSSNSLLHNQTEGVEALLSAVVTNHQTCSDGLEMTSSAGSVRNSLSLQLSNGTRFYSISLAFFKHAWGSNEKKGNPHSGRKLMFSKIESSRILNAKRNFFEWRRGRKLLQTVSDSIVVRDIVTVNQNRTGNFTTINDAVTAAPNNTNISGGFFVIYVQAGVYKEYVSIAKNKKNIMMIGDGINQTVITGNRSVVDGWTTFNSATFAVVGERFVAVNITFRNTAGAIKQQAVAMRSGADLSAFYSCSFEGYQDTLYTHSLRQFYRECDVYGTVDFIFGNAAVVFQKCNIFPRLPMQGQSNTITAQGRTDPNQNTGTSIHECKVTPAADLVNSSTQTYLGRPWKEYSTTVYMQSFMDSFINPAGWMPWSGDFALSTLYYAEYHNSGTGSNTSNRVTWAGYHVINATDASNFTVSNFLLGDNWIPTAGVPYDGGLL